MKFDWTVITLFFLVALHIGKWIYDYAVGRTRQKMLSKQVAEIKNDVKDGFRSVWKTVDKHSQDIARMQGQRDGVDK